MDCRKARTYFYTIERPEKGILPREVLKHLNQCAACAREWQQVQLAANRLAQLKEIAPPGEMMEHYFSDLHRKIRQLAATEPVESRWSRLGWLRPAIGLLALVVLSVTIWWFGVHTPPNHNNDPLMTESLDYYLESFQKEAAQNSVAVVKGMEYQWALSSYSGRGK